MELPGLREARQRRLLTQAELAIRADVTAATISRIETGTTKARISTIRRLAEVLDIDPAELLAPSNKPPKTDHQKGPQR